MTVQILINAGMLVAEWHHHRGECPTFTELIETKFENIFGDDVTHDLFLLEEEDAGDIREAGRISVQWPQECK